MYRLLSLIIVPLVVLGNVVPKRHGGPDAPTGTMATPHFHIGHSHSHDHSDGGFLLHEHGDDVGTGSRRGPSHAGHTDRPFEHDRDAVYLAVDSWYVPIGCRVDSGDSSARLSVCCFARASRVNACISDRERIGHVRTGRDRLLLHAALRL
ncbi:MAG: hypothetical protein AAF670_05360 [Planctomycetota bacterium]